MVTESGGVLQPKHAYLFSNVSLKNFVIKKKHRFNLLCELLTKMVIILDSRFLIRAIILFLIIIVRYFFTFFSLTNGFQENHSFSFASILPHGVCCVVYHPQHSLLIVGSLTGQGQRMSVGKLSCCRLRFYRKIKAVQKRLQL